MPDNGLAEGKQEKPKGKGLLAKGKKLHDKRETIKERTWNRERARLMREKG